MGKKGRLAAIAAGVIVAVVGGAFAWVNLTYQRDFSTTPLPKITASADPKVIAQGAYLTNAVAHCSSCHGNGDYTNKSELPPDPNDLRGGFVLKAGPFGTFRPANITPDAETGIGKRSDAELARVIRHGVGASGRFEPLMALGVGPMADEDLTAVVSYLRSIPAIRNPVAPDEWGLVAKAISGKFSPRMATAPKYVPAGEASIARGEYLANGPAVCFSCHTRHDAMKGFAESSPRFSGGEGEEDASDPSFEIIAPNLTPDPETGVLANHTEESFIERVRIVGQTTKGSAMPWNNFKKLTDDDLKSIFRYLRSIPPVKNATGPGRRKKKA